MKLKYLILALLIAATTSLSAQQYAEDYIIHKGGAPRHHNKVEMVYGVLGGVILPQLSEKGDDIDVSNKAGYGFGMMWGLKFGGIEFVPEIWYTHANTTLNKSGNDNKYDLVSHDIEVPLIFSIPVGESGLRFNVGPTFSMLNNSKLKEDGKDYTDFGRTKSTSGYLIGASLTLFEHLILDFRYTGRYIATDVPWFSGDDIYRYRYYNFGFNVGYRF